MTRKSLNLSDLDKLEYLEGQQRHDLEYLFTYYNQQISDYQMFLALVHFDFLPSNYPDSHLNRDDMLLQAFDRIVQNHGIEAVRSSRWSSPYYGNAVGLYSNTGDSYIPTLCRNNIVGELRICDYEELVKWCEEEGAKDEG